MGVGRGQVDDTPPGKKKKTRTFWYSVQKKPSETHSTRDAGVSSAKLQEEGASEEHSGAQQQQTEQDH